MIVCSCVHSAHSTAPEKVFQYLKKQNRPYSASKPLPFPLSPCNQSLIYKIVDIFNNLHKEFGKPVSGQLRSKRYTLLTPCPVSQCVQRTLDGLVAESKLREKTYGKQKVYVASQVQYVRKPHTPLTPSHPPQSLFPAVDDSELKAMDQKLTALQQTLKERQTECHTLESS